MHAICLRCGETKDAPDEKCGGCGYHPKDNESLVKSVYLSIGRYDAPAKQMEYRYELQKLAKQIREGNIVAFDSVEIIRLQKQKIEVETVSDLGGVRYLTKVFLPGFLFLLLLLGVLVALKMR